MKIRDKLTLRFTTLVGVLMLVVLGSIYITAVQNIHAQFYQDLKDRTAIVAEMYLKNTAIDSALYDTYEDKLLDKLNGEVIQVFDDAGNNYIFEHNDTLNISKEILKRIAEDKEYNYEVGHRQTAGVYLQLKQGNFSVVVSAMNIKGHKQLQRLSWLMIAVYILSLIVIVIAGRFFAINALSDIPRMVKQVRRISGSSLHVRLKEGTGKDELAELAHTFNQMLQRIEASFDREKTFVNHASHELRTPLTAMISQMDVLLSKERSNEEYRETMQSILADAQQLTAMTTGLLSLAKLKSGEGEIKKDAIRLDALLEDACDIEMKDFPNANVSINFNSIPDDEEKMYIHGDYPLLLIAFSNLVENAIKFSESKPVNITLDFAEKNPIVTIADKGMGIPADDLEKIFQPFYRSPVAMNVKGHGIGLALVKTIFELHNYTIQYYSEENKGTTVVVKCH